MQSSGRISLMKRPSVSLSEAISPYISTLSTDSFESWVLVSKVYIFSISLPKRERRNG